MLIACNKLCTSITIFGRMAHNILGICWLQRGVAALPDLHVSDSSEAMLSGRKPPFRLLVRAVHRDGRPTNIRHAVSEGFVVSGSCHTLNVILRALLMHS